MDVFVLIAHPRDTTSFVVDIYRDRERAEADRAALAADTPVELVAHELECPHCAGPRRW